MIPIYDEAEDLSNYINCSSADNLDVKIFLGVSKDDTCSGNILWYEDGTDFTATSREGGMEAETNDVEGNTALMQAEVSAFTFTRTYEIKPSFGSRLYQKFLEIQMRDSQENYNGELIRRYMNGGFHFKIEANSIDGSFKLVEYSLQLLSNNFPDTLFTQTVGEVDSISMEFQLNQMPFYRILGVLPPTFGLPQELTAPKITLGTNVATVNSIILTGYSVVDPDLLTDTEKGINFVVVNKTQNNTQIATGNFQPTGTTIVLPSGSVAVGDEVVIDYGFYATSLAIPSATETVVIS